MGNQLPYDNIGELRQRMADVAPHLAKNDTVESPMWLNGEYFKVRLCLTSFDMASVMKHSEFMSAMASRVLRGCIVLVL